MKGYCVHLRHNNLTILSIGKTAYVEQCGGGPDYKVEFEDGTYQGYFRIMRRVE